MCSSTFITFIRRYHGHGLQVYHCALCTALLPLLPRRPTLTGWTSSTCEPPLRGSQPRVRLYQSIYVLQFYLHHTQQQGGVWAHQKYFVYFFAILRSWIRTTSVHEVLHPHVWNPACEHMSLEKFACGDVGVSTEIVLVERQGQSLMHQPEGGCNRLLSMNHM